MALPPGTRLGSYEISAQIGAGGMGEVYKATDTYLKRAVAIKVLPAAVAADVGRLARFQREAEILAALNFTLADSEFDRCIGRRGEALALFLDEEPTYGFLPAVYYYQGQVREGPNTAVCGAVPKIPRYPRREGR